MLIGQKIYTIEIKQNFKIMKFILQLLHYYEIVALTNGGYSHAQKPNQRPNRRIIPRP